MKTSVFGASLLVAALSSPSTVAAEDQEPMLQLSSDSSFHFEILAPLAEAVASGADVGPVLGAAKNIKAGDFDSFSEVFYNLANETKAQAEDPQNAYDPVNVRDTWFSASSYFRRADFYLHGNWSNPLIKSLWDEQTAAFDKGLAALPIPGHRVKIPAGNFTVEAIWYSPSDDKSRQKRPTLILGNGYDGAQEDLYHTIVIPALARGWNCITYEGPGHPTVRRDQDLGFIPDWERVVTPVVDYVLKKKGDVVDKSKLVLFGYSFGGYLAARAAAFEPRLSAVVLDGGVWSAYDSFSSSLPKEAIELLDSGNRTAFDQAAQQLASAPGAPTDVRWGLEQGLWAFRTHSAFDFLQTTKQYTVKDIIHKIKVPVFIMDAEYEGFFAGASKKVKDALGDQATLHTFNGTAGYHCQIGAFQELNRVLFAWLHETLSK